MTNKNESHETKSENDGVVPKGDTKRKRLLARVAGQVAAALLVSPSPKVNSLEKMAEVSVDIAEAILHKAGL